MSAEFDPYREWLGVKSPQRPPNYYQLLDLKLYESDRERIENAEMIQMAKVLRHESGPHAALAARLGRELEAAVRCLLDTMDKATYDADLFIAPRAPQPSAGDIQAAAAAIAPPPEKPAAAASPGAESYDFGADLKLDEDEEEEADDFSADLKLPEEEPEAKAEPEPTPVARAASPRPAPARDKAEDAPQKPSLMEMLDQPAKGKETAKGKDAAGAKKVALPSYDPPPIPKKSFLPAMPQMPSASGKLIAAVAAIVVAALAVWYVPGMLPPSKPNPAKILAKIENSDPQTRIDGIDHLQTLEMDPQEASSLLVKVLKEDQTDAVRLAAVNALVNNGTPTPQVSAELKTLLEKEQHASVKAMLQWLIESGGR